MKFVLIKCWHIKTSAFDLDVISSSQPDIQLIKKNILKSGYRAFCTDEKTIIQNSEWYKSFLLGEIVRFYIDGSGVYRLANIDLSESELYFEKDNMPAGYKPWIFYSWQSDYNSSRSNIKDALKEIVDHINKNLNPKVEIELVEATREEDGVKDILQAIKEKIDRCLFAVFDITNVAIVDKEGGEVVKGKQEAKQYPNANVVFELSYALSRKRFDQMAFVKKERDELKPDKAPFDFEHYKILSYDKPAKMKSDLKTIIVEAFNRFNIISANKV